MKFFYPNFDWKSLPVLDYIFWVREIVRGFDALGCSGASRLHPCRVGIPHGAIILHAVDANPIP